MAVYLINVSPVYVCFFCLYIGDSLSANFDLPWFWLKPIEVLICDFYGGEPDW